MGPLRNNLQNSSIIQTSKNDIKQSQLPWPSVRKGKNLPLHPDSSQMFDLSEPFSEKVYLQVRALTLFHPLFEMHHFQMQMKTWSWKPADVDCSIKWHKTGCDFNLVGKEAQEEDRLCLNVLPDSVKSKRGCKSWRESLQNLAIVHIQLQNWAQLRHISSVRWSNVCAWWGLVDYLYLFLE